MHGCDHRVRRHRDGSQPRGGRKVTNRQAFTRRRVEVEQDDGGGARVIGRRGGDDAAPRVPQRAREHGGVTVRRVRRQPGREVRRGRRHAVTSGGGWGTRRVRTRLRPQRRVPPAAAAAHAHAHDLGGSAPGRRGRARRG